MRERRETEMDTNKICEGSQWKKNSVALAKGQLQRKTYVTIDTQQRKQSALIFWRGKNDMRWKLESQQKKIN